MVNCALQYRNQGAFSLIPATLDALIQSEASPFVEIDQRQQRYRWEQPPGLTIEALKQHLPLPIDWGEQRKLLGFIQP
jgi:hypothetical protein